MVCMCGDKECEFEKLIAELENVQNLIFTPKSSIKFREFIHVLASGVRIINIDLAFGTKKELQILIKNINWAIKIFLCQSKFNFQITKVCSIRGRVQRTGRMTNNCNWDLCLHDVIVLTCDKRYQNCSSNEVCYVSNFQRFASFLAAADVIRIGSELVLRVEKVALNSHVTCSVIKEGRIEAYQEVKMPQLEDDQTLEPTEEELEDCELAKSHGFDFIIIPSVKKSEQFHVINDLIRGSEIETIAQIDTSLGDKETINRIIQHFYGIYVEESSAYSSAYIISQAREFKKLLITRQGTQEFQEIADSLLMNPSKCANRVVNASVVSTNECGRDFKSRQQSVHFDDENVCVKTTFELSQKPETRAIVSLTQRRKTAESIAHARPDCPIILLTKCSTIAKRLQMWKNVHAMVYVECENKPLKDQRNEMMQIAGLYGIEMKMFEADLRVTCCYSGTANIDDEVLEPF